MVHGDHASSDDSRTAPLRASLCAPPPGRAGASRNSPIWLPSASVSAYSSGSRSRISSENSSIAPRDWSPLRHGERHAAVQLAAPPPSRAGTCPWPVNRPARPDGPAPRPRRAGPPRSSHGSRLARSNCSTSDAVLVPVGTQCSPRRRRRPRTARPAARAAARSPRAAAGPPRRSCPPRRAPVPRRTAPRGGPVTLPLGAQVRDEQPTTTPPTATTMVPGHVRAAAEGVRTTIPRRHRDHEGEQCHGGGVTGARARGTN